VIVSSLIPFRPRSAKYAIASPRAAVASHVHKAPPMVRNTSLTIRGNVVALGDLLAGLEPTGGGQRWVFGASDWERAGTFNRLEDTMAPKKKDLPAKKDVKGGLKRL